jgi:hypothetical protein
MSTQAAFKEEVPPAPNVSACPELYTLEVALLSGPVSESFAEENPDVIRTIQIRGEQTLEDLHDIIFTSLDREDDNMYEFRVGSTPNDPEGTYYVLPSELKGKASNRKNIAGDVTKSRICSLKLRPGDSFTYWFDFSDEWIHRITVKTIDETIPSGKYPRIIARIGESPAQYGEPDEDAEEGEEDYIDEEQWNMVY